MFIIACNAAELRVLLLQFSNSFIEHAVQMPKQSVKMYVTVVLNVLAVLHSSLVFIIYITTRRTLNIQWIVFVK